MKYINAVKIFVFDLAKFKIDDLKIQKYKKEISNKNQEAFFTFWLDRTTTEPLKDGYCYGGQYFNIKERHKECNYKIRKKGITEHREFFYNIKENLIDIIKNDALITIREYTKKTIVGKIKTQYKFYYVWDYQTSEYYVIEPHQYDQITHKIIISFDTWE